MKAIGPPNIKKVKACDCGAAIEICECCVCVAQRACMYWCARREWNLIQHLVIPQWLTRGIPCMCALCLLSIVVLCAIMQVRVNSLSSLVPRIPLSRFCRPSSERLPFLQPHRPPPCFFPRMEYFWAGRPNDNHSLIELLKLSGVVIKSEKIAEAMEQIDRKLFVPDKQYAYVDSPMPIGFNATISAPHMHALCLELLQDHLKPGMRALDVGSGTGYLTACFSIMVGKEGRVVGVEHIPELVERSIENVKASKAAPLLEAGSLSLHAGDGRLGWPSEAPYDAIHVGAAASEVPDALLEQLRLGGRMVIPVGDEFQELRVIDKQIDGSLKESCETSVRYVPLTSRNEQLKY